MNSTYHYFTIWNNGIKHLHKILHMIETYGAFDVLRILKHTEKNIIHLVESLYSTDTVPLKHLKSKTKYLLKSNPTVFFIFVRNNRPDEKLTGRGSFRHMQCLTIVDIKNLIRDKFNPKKSNGDRTEEHVVHGSDYQDQTAAILKYLNLTWDIVLKPPIYYSKQADIKKVSLDSIQARVVSIPKVVSIQDTPHYKYLQGNKEIYKKYWRQYIGIKLKDNHTPYAFDVLLKEFKYPYKHNLITVHNNIIVDGLHRAAILKHKGVDECLIMFV